MKKRKQIKRVLYVCLMLILVLVMMYSGLRLLESTVLSPAVPEQQETVRKTITRNGVDYFPRQDITVMLVMGIDQYGPIQASQAHQNPGSADMVALLIFDEVNQTCDALCLNRDTMLEMPVLGIGGREAGTYFGQLALAHTYGTGMEDSCENVRKTVSNLLYGITVDYYVAMNMDAIGILNDAVGGVTVMVEDDFSAIDPSIDTGEVTLRGEQALNFVRTRKDVGNQLNISRMERQKQYIEGFVKAFRDSLQGEESFILETYETVSPYVLSDCSVNTLSNMLSRYSEFTIGRIVTPEGENVLGRTYYEFYLDEEKLDPLILELFYAPK